MTREEMMIFAKDQTEIFPEDSIMGEYLRQSILLMEKMEKIYQIRQEWWDDKIHGVDALVRINGVLEDA